MNTLLTNFLLKRAEHSIDVFSLNWNIATIIIYVHIHMQTNDFTVPTMNFAKQCTMSTKNNKWNEIIFKKLSNIKNFLNQLKQLLTQLRSTPKNMINR